MFILKLEATTLFLDFEGGPIPDEVNLALAEEFKYETLEYVPGNKYNGGHAGYVKQSAYVYNKDKHCIPWGLFGDVKQFLEQNFPQYCWGRVYDSGHASTHGRVRPATYNKTQYPVAVHKEITPEHYQLEAVEAAINSKFGMIELPTGSGKSLCYLTLIERLQPAVTLLAVSGTELIEQTYKQVVAMFPRATVKQWNCTASNKQKKEAVLWDPRDMTIIVCSYQTFNNYVGAPIVDAIDLVLMDEIQKITCDTFSPVVNKTPYAYSRIGFSATPFRDDNATMLVQGYCGPIIYRQSLRYMVDNGFLAQPIIKTANMFSVQGLCWLIEKSLTNKIIVFHEQKVKGVEQSKAIFEEIAKELPDAWQPFAQQFFASSFFVSSDKKSCRQELEEFKQCKAGCIFTTPLMDVGVDIPDANIAVFLQVNGKRKGAVVTPVQRIGRVLRVPKGQRGQAFLADPNRKTGLCVIHHDPHKDGRQPTRTCNLYKTLTNGYFSEFDHGDPFLFPSQ